MVTSGSYFYYFLLQFKSQDPSVGSKVDRGVYGPLHTHLHPPTLPTWTCDVQPTREHENDFNFVVATLTGNVVQVRGTEWLFSWPGSLNRFPVPTPVYWGPPVHRRDHSKTQSPRSNGLTLDPTHISSGWLEPTTVSSPKNRWEPRYGPETVEPHPE